MFLSFQLLNPEGAAQGVDDGISTSIVACRVGVKGRHHDSKQCSSTRSSFGDCSSPVGSHDCRDDREAKSCATGRSRTRGICAKESFEDRRRLFLADPWAVVCYFDERFVTYSSDAHARLGADWSMGTHIREQVVDYLAEHSPVAHDLDRFVGSEGQWPLGTNCSSSLDCFSSQANQLDRLGVEHVVFVEASKYQQVFDEARHPSSLPFDAIHHPGEILFTFRGSLLEELRVGRHCRDRGPQFM